MPYRTIARSGAAVTGAGCAVMVVMSAARQRPHDLHRNAFGTQLEQQAAALRGRHVAFRRKRAQRQHGQRRQQDLVLVFEPSNYHYFILAFGGKAGN